MPRTLFVTRHAGALEWARRRNIEAEIVPHLDPEKLAAGDVVIGTLPIHIVAQLNAKGVRYRHLSMEIPADARGKDIDADAMERFGARLEEFFAYAPQEPPPNGAEAPGERLSWFERHQAYTGAAVAALAAGAVSWLVSAAGNLYAAIYPDPFPTGAGVVAGVSSRFAQLVAPHLDQAVGARLVDVAAPLLAFGVLAYWSFILGRRILRPRIASRRADPSRGRKAVVMALSDLRGDENLSLARQGATMPLAAVCAANWPTKMSWQQNARALRHHLAAGSRLIVCVVCSKESWPQFELFRAFVEGTAASVGASIELREAVGGVVDFDDYAAVETRFRETLESLRREDRLKFCDMCVDATSGTKVISIAAAVATMNHEVEFSYVSNAGDVRLFDARLPTADKVLPG